MLQTINNVKNGLNPEVLEEWYSIIEKDAKSKCPENVKDSIKVIRNPALPLKFEFKSKGGKSFEVVPFLNIKLFAPSGI